MALKIQNCVLGNHYLTRKSGLFWIAPSGQGKSTVAMQATVCWACGRIGFDIDPSFPLRITMIQAEDDESDLAEQAQVINWLELSTHERDLVAKNAWIETVNDKVGDAAIMIFDQVLQQKPCDLFVLNPYTAYLGADSKDEEANSVFLRSHFQALLNKHNCAALIFHHTPKTNFRSNTARWTTMDWMYSGAGAAILTNWARAIVAMDPLAETGVYKFIAAKRYQRIGWDYKINYFRHDQRPGVLLWSKASPSEVAQASGLGCGHDITPQEILKPIPVLDGISITHLRRELEKLASVRKVKIAIDLALEDGLIHSQTIKGSGHSGRIKMIFRGSNHNSNYFNEDNL